MIFAGLIPTMGLVRSTAIRMESVKKSQKLLSNLPKNQFASGFQITAHFFGAVINTGVFAMLAAAMPPNCNSIYRQVAAQASLRGMASSATWSPFFVAFIVGQVYIDGVSAWLGLAVGLLIGLSFTVISILVLNKHINLIKLKASLNCLYPVASTLLTIIILIIGAATIFGLTALSAVIIVMPILVGFYFIKTPSDTNPIMRETLAYLRTSVDDVVIISIAMLVGFFVTNSPETLGKLSALSFFAIPNWSVLIFIPVTMAVASFIGIHPVISSTVLLSVFTSEGFTIAKPLIMQAHLIGWCTGTMSSIASLSVITCSNLFKTPTWKLCFGVNTYTTIVFALLGGSTLSILNTFY